MINAGIPSLSPVNQSFFSSRALVTITNVAEQRRLNQAAAQRRRRVCCAQTRLDAEHGGATLQLNTCRSCLLPQFPSCLKMDGPFLIKAIRGR